MEKGDFRNLAETLTDDVFLHVKDEPEISDNHRRRSFVRSVFAMVEGMTYASKQAILDEFGPKLGPAEIALITEESFDLDDSGRSKSRPLFLPLAKNVRFMFDLLIRFWEIPLEVNVGGRGWQGFLAAIQVRNRLTHPKQSSDLTVSDKDLKNVHIANRWFTANVMLAYSYRLNNQVKKEGELLDLIASIAPEKAAEMRTPLDSSPETLSYERREEIFARCFRALADL